MKQIHYTDSVISVWFPVWKELKNQTNRHTQESRYMPVCCMPSIISKCICYCANLQGGVNVNNLCRL